VVTLGQNRSSHYGEWNPGSYSGEGDTPGQGEGEPG
jgi:hypothetical protein